MNLFYYVLYAVSGMSVKNSTGYGLRAFIATAVNAFSFLSGMVMEVWWRLVIGTDYAVAKAY